jgi:hypothetical protein
MPVIITRGSFLEGWEACAAVLPHSVFVIVGKHVGMIRVCFPNRVLDSIDIRGCRLDRS